MKPRLLFFDLLRILAIGMVVIQHISLNKWLNLVIPLEATSIPFVGTIGIGQIGIMVFIFCSGAVLEYQYSKVNQWLSFIYKRVTRVYPAYWISLILGMLFLNASWTGQTVWTLLDQGLGLSKYLVINHDLMFNPVGWFIGLIVIFYILFPALTWILDKYPLSSSIIIICGSFTCRELLFIINPDPSGMGLFHWYISPLSNIGLFFLGMVVTKYHLFPNIVNKYTIIIFLSELSFYIFLVHQPIRKIWDMNWILFVIGVLLLSFMLMAVDEKIQDRIRRPT